MRLWDRKTVSVFPKIPVDLFWSGFFPLTNPNPMKRRDALKTAAAFSAISIISPFAKAIEYPLACDELKNVSGKIKRFGDGRDWFFEKRYGMFVH